MGQKYLIDSNVIIDYVSGKLPVPQMSLIEKIPIIISVVTRIEILSSNKPTSSQKEKLEYFINNAAIIPLDEEIIMQTIKLRQKYKIKLADGIIAATALTQNLT